MNVQLPQPQKPPELTLDALAVRLNERELQIDATADAAIQKAADVVVLAVEQGGDLLMAKRKLPYGEFLPWLKNNFPKSIRRAHEYMQLATEYHCKGADFFRDARSIKGAFRILGLVPELPEKPPTPGISIPPIIERLNFVAEWFHKSGETIKTWPAEQRAEFRTRLKPLVDLWRALADEEDG